MQTSPLTKAEGRHVSSRMMSSSRVPGIRQTRVGLSKLRSTEKQRHGHPALPNIRFSSVVSLLREGSCPRPVTGSLERRHLTPVLFFFPPPQSFAFCHLHKLVSIWTPLDSKPDRCLNPWPEGQPAWPVTPKQRFFPPHHTFGSWMVSLLLIIRWPISSFGFLFRKFHTANLPKKGSNPQPYPEL